ncbi:hypothetical protein BH24BAC1_BH24BAC1_34310 [soil metagenome]|jgi:hypothetical protein
MKALPTLLFLTAVFLFTGCEESQNYRPLHKINGDWHIQRLRYVDRQTGKDSTATPTGDHLIFNLCTKEMNKQPTVCEGSYQVEGEGFVFPLTYQVTSNETLYIQGKSVPAGVTAQYRRIEDVLAGGYDIVQLDDTHLSLVSEKECQVSPPGSCRYRVEIDAVRLQ